MAKKPYEWMSDVDPSSFKATEPEKALRHWHAEYDRLMSVVVELAKREDAGKTADWKNEWRAARHERNIAAARMSAFVPYVLDLSTPPF